MRCRQCEHENALGYIYCENCGEKLPKEEKAAPVYVPASEESAAQQEAKDTSAPPAPVQQQAASQAASPAPQVVVIERERERRRRFPGWLWLILGLLLGPICLCSMAWASIIPLPDGFAAGIERAADSLGDGIGDPVTEVVTDIQRRQAKNPPIIGGDGDLGDIAGNICDDWPFPWLPFNCPGDGPVAIVLPGGNQDKNNDPAPEAQAPAAPAQNDNDGNDDQDSGDPCLDYEPFNEFHTVTYYDEQGHLYAVVNTDGGVEGHLDYWLESPISSGVNGCSINSSTQLVCRIGYADQLGNWQGTIVQASIFVEINPNDPLDRCYLVADVVDIPFPEQAAPDAEEEEDEDEGGGRSSCSSGYYQVDGKADGFCCPNGTSYNASTNKCDY